MVITPGTSCTRLGIGLLLIVILISPIVGCSANSSEPPKVAPVTLPVTGSELPVTDAVFVVPRPGSSLDFDSNLVVVPRAPLPTARILDIPGRGTRGIGVARLSPDGSQALVQVHHDAAFFEWHTVDMAGSGAKKITTPTNGKASWSLSGASVAWEDLSTPGGCVMVADLNTGFQKKLAASASDPAWSPDGGRLIYVAQDHTNPDSRPVLSTCRISDGQVSVLFDPESHAKGSGRGSFIHSPIWSLEANHIAFVYEGKSLDGAGIYVVDVGNATGESLSGMRRPARLSGFDDLGTVVHNMVWLPDESLAWADKAGLMLAQRGSGKEPWSVKRIATTQTSGGGIQNLQLSPLKDRLFWAETSASEPNGQHLMWLDLRNWETSRVVSGGFPTVVGGVAGDWPIVCHYHTRALTYPRFPQHLRPQACFTPSV